MPEPDAPLEGMTTGELLGYWKDRCLKAERHLDSVRMDQAQDGFVWPHVPALVYCAAGSSLRVQVDDADLGFLSVRERVLCVALLRHALARFEEVPDA